MEKNLHHEEAIKKFKKLAEEIRICMFITGNRENGDHTRPMATIDVEDDGSLWFFTDLRTPKIGEIQTDPTVHLIYAHPGKDSYMDVLGTATIHTDVQLKKDKWKPIVKGWFDSPEDPNIALMRVQPHDVYYWDLETAKMVQFFRIAAAMVTGNKKIADAAEGSLDL
jgi:general stress protein 26